MLRRLALLGVLAVVSAVLVGVGVGSSDDARAQVDPSVRTLTVIGSAFVNTAPDTATWSFGIDSRAKTAAAALKKNTRTINRIVAAVRKLGVPRSDIQTQNVSVFAIRPGTPRQQFRASNQVSVVVRDLAKGGQIVAAVTEAGANNVFGPQFSVSDPDDVRKQATDQAFDEATQKAADLAAKAGVTLGQVHSIEEGSSFGQFGLGFASAAESAAAPPLLPGQQPVGASLRVTFLIQ